MATAWFLGCASVHPSGKRNTTVASPTVPSRLSLNYHPFRQEVSIQASWAYISVTSNIRGLSSIFQEYDLRSPLLKKRPDSIKDSALIHQHNSPPVHGFTISIVILHTQIMLVRIKEQTALHAARERQKQIAPGGRYRQRNEGRNSHSQFGISLCRCEEQ